METFQVGGLSLTAAGRPELLLVRPNAPPPPQMLLLQLLRPAIASHNHHPASAVRAMLLDFPTDSHFARGGEILKSEEREREWEDGRSAMDWLSHGWEQEEVLAGGRKWGRILRGRSWTKRETFDPPLIRPSKPSFKDIQETSQQGSISSILAHSLSNPNQTDFRI